MKVPFSGTMLRYFVTDPAPINIINKKFTAL